MKTRVTDKEPNNFCQDFLHISLQRLQFPPRALIPALATTGHYLLPLCECVCVCVWGVSFGLALCLANYVLVLEPSPRLWPLPPSSQQTALHSTTLSRCLSHYRFSLAHERRSEGGKWASSFFFPPFKSSEKFHLRLSFSLLVKLFVVYTRLSVHALSALQSAIFAAVIKAINSCECIPFSWVSFCLGPTTNNNATRSAHYFLMAYLSRAPQSNQTADNESKEAI